MLYSLQKAFIYFILFRLRQICVGAQDWFHLRRTCSSWVILGSSYSPILIRWGCCEAARYSQLPHPGHRRGMWSTLRPSSLPLSSRLGEGHLSSHSRMWKDVIQGLSVVTPSPWGWAVYSRKINPTQREVGHGEGGQRDGKGERDGRREREGASECTSFGSVVTPLSYLVTRANKFSFS